MNLSKTALLDGDAWVYRCGFAAEKTEYLVEHGGSAQSYAVYSSAKEAKADKNGIQIWSRKEIEPVENCLQTVKTSLENTLDVLGNPDYKLFLSGRRNFRDDIFPDYKANRDGSSKPRYYRAIRDYLVSQWGGRVVEGIEADDAIGIAASDSGWSSIIVAVDKDLDQLPGLHYNWVKGHTYNRTASEGMKFFYEQLLSGDPTDNIPGIEGIGPVRAAKQLADCKTPQECARSVFDAYKQEYGDNAEPVTERNASLVWIKRDKDLSHPFWRHLGKHPGDL